MSRLQYRPTGSGSAVGWEGNRRSGVALAMHHRLWYICHTGSTRWVWQPYLLPLPFLHALFCTVPPLGNWGSVSELEFNVPFQHKYGYIRDESDRVT